MWKCDDPAYPRIDVYGSLDELERRLRRAPRRPAPAGHRRAHPAQPRRPHRAGPRCGASPTSSTAGSSRARCPSPRCTTRSRTPTGSSRTSPATSSSSTSARPAAGSTRCTCWPPRCSTGPRSRPASSTACCSATTARSCRSGCATTPTRSRCSTPSAPTPCAGRCCRSAAVRGGDMVADRRPMEEAVRQVLLPIWNAWYFLTLYANAAGRTARRRPPATPTVLDRYALAKARQLVEAVTDRMDAYDLSGACAEVLAYLDSLNNWYIRRSRDRFWAGDQAAVDTLHTGARGALPGGGAAAAAAHRHHLAGAHRRARRCTWPTGPTPTTLPARPRAGRGHGRRARGVLGGVVGPQGRAASGSGCRWRPSPSPRPTPSGLAPLRRPHRRRGQRQGGRAHRPTSPPWPSWCSQLVPAVLGPRVGADVQKLLGAVPRPASRDRTADGGVVVAGRALGRRRVRAAPRAQGGRRRRAAARRPGRGRPRRRGHPRAGGRGPGPRRGPGRQRGPPRPRASTSATASTSSSTSTRHHDVADGRARPTAPHHGRGARRPSWWWSATARATTTRPTGHRVELSDGRAIHLSIARADA